MYEPPQGLTVKPRRSTSRAHIPASRPAELCQDVVRGHIGPVERAAPLQDQRRRGGVKGPASVPAFLLVGFLVVYVKWIAAVIAAYLAYRWWRVAWVALGGVVVDAWEREQKAIAARARQTSEHGFGCSPVGPTGEGAGVPKCGA